MSVDDPLNFHSSHDLQQPTRIRNAYLADGHVTEPPPTAPSCQCHPQKHRREVEINKYERKMLDNYHHEVMYCPCKDVTAEYLRDKNG